MDLKTYYNPLIIFFEDLKKKYQDDKKVSVLYNSNNFEDADEIKFLSNNDNLYTFSITLWTNIYDFPRVGLYIKHPDKDEYYEVVDEFNGGKEIDLIELLEYIKSILSNKFIFDYEFLNGKLIKTTYTYYTPANGYIDKRTDVFKKKLLVFPWQKGKIIKKRYEFGPWYHNV